MNRFFNFDAPALSAIDADLEQVNQQPQAQEVLEEAISEEPPFEDPTEPAFDANPSILSEMNTSAPNPPQLRFAGLQVVPPPFARGSTAAEDTWRLQIKTFLDQNTARKAFADSQVARLQRCARKIQKNAELPNRQQKTEIIEWLSGRWDEEVKQCEAFFVWFTDEQKSWREARGNAGTDDAPTADISVSEWNGVGDPVYEEPDSEQLAQSLAINAQVDGRREFFDWVKNHIDDQERFVGLLGLLYAYNGGLVDLRFQ